MSTKKLISFSLDVLRMKKDGYTKDQAIELNNLLETILYAFEFTKAKFPNCWECGTKENHITKAFMACQRIGKAELHQYIEDLYIVELENIHDMLPAVVGYKSEAKWGTGDEGNYILTLIDAVYGK